VRTWSLIAVLTIAWTFSGCMPGEDPQVVQWREQILLPDEPTGAVTIADARQHVDEQPEIVLIGRVGVQDIPQWWEKDRATLLMSEGYPGSDYNPGPDHDPQTCPFCRWKWKFEESMAAIAFVDAAGDVIPVDVRTLLKLTEEDVVVVRGTGSLDESGILNVTATGVFVRKRN
jgi:hypothetical protein